MQVFLQNFPKVKSNPTLGFNFGFINVFERLGLERRILSPRATTRCGDRKQKQLEIPTFPQENGQPPCFMRIFFHVRDSTFRFAPPRKLNLSPFRASKIESWI